MNRSYKSKGTNSLDRRNVIESPSLTRLDGGIVNEGFTNSFSQIPSPSFFYIDNTNNWLDSSPNANRRFTESWIELEQAYSCGSSVSERRCCHCPRFCRVVICLIITLCLLGIAAVVAGILYMEVFHESKVSYSAYTNMPSAVLDPSSTLLPNVTEAFNYTRSTVLPKLKTSIAQTVAKRFLNANSTTDELTINTTVGLSLVPDTTITTVPSDGLDAESTTMNS